MYPLAQPELEGPIIHTIFLDWMGLSRFKNLELSESNPQRLNDLPTVLEEEIRISSSDSWFLFFI